MAAVHQKGKEKALGASATHRPGLATLPAAELRGEHLQPHRRHRFITSLHRRSRAEIFEAKRMTE
jgi:hypothetical protein